MPATLPTLYLASNSPRRRELLTQLSVPFLVEAADIDESQLPQERPEPYVERLAREKARVVAARHPGSLVLAADTSVILDEEILGKPSDVADARAMLSRLSGTTHRVLTGVALAGPSGTRHCVVSTEVRFRPLSSAEIAWYAATGEPLDKSGSYALQGIGAFMVKAIHGSASNVVGLPLAETLALLAEAGLVLPWSTP